ncbi:hypothetical protein pipiens_016476, partial [Culex pipiens pipiens]
MQIVLNLSNYHNMRASAGFDQTIIALLGKSCRMKIETSVPYAEHTL